MTLKNGPATPGLFDRLSAPQQHDAVAALCFVFLAICVLLCTALGWCLHRIDDLKEEEQRMSAPIDFVTEFNHTARSAHANAVDKGFWERNPAAPELIALAHSELSEMLEAYRRGNGPSSKIENFSAAEEELADLVIRAMDMAEGLELRLAEAIVAKMAYNVSRARMHGNKKF